jgi:hypothetical protein
MSETARRFFIVSSSYEVNGPLSTIALEGMFRKFATVPRGVIAAGEVPKPVRLEQRDKKMPPGNRTAF